MLKRLIFSVFLLLFVLGCQKNMFPVAMVEEPTDNPEYTVEPDPNK